MSIRQAPKEIKQKRTIFRQVIYESTTFWLTGKYCCVRYQAYVPNSRSMPTSAFCSSVLHHFRASCFSTVNRSATAPICTTHLRFRFAYEDQDSETKATYLPRRHFLASHEDLHRHALQAPPGRSQSPEFLLFIGAQHQRAVSYTHLTLPTILLV